MQYSCGHAKDESPKIGMVGMRNLFMIHLPLTEGVRYISQNIRQKRVIDIYYKTRVFERPMPESRGAPKMGQMQNASSLILSLSSPDWADGHLAAAEPHATFDMSEIYLGAGFPQQASLSRCREHSIPIALKKSTDPRKGNAISR
jgi:hypothetical protein